MSYSLSVTIIYGNFLLVWWLVTLKTFITDEPARPGKPEIIDYDNTMVCLKWAKPETDGGRPITHYVVEMKDKFAADWAEVAKTENDTPEAKVEGLKEKMVYQFRVRAVNKAGLSEPSEPTDNHLCKHRHCEYNNQHLQQGV